MDRRGLKVTQVGLSPARSDSLHLAWRLRSLHWSASHLFSALMTGGETTNCVDLLLRWRWPFRHVPGKLDGCGILPRRRLGRRGAPDRIRARGQANRYRAHRRCKETEASHHAAWSRAPMKARPVYTHETSGMGISFTSFPPRERGHGTVQAGARGLHNQPCSTQSLAAARVKSDGS